MSHRATEERMGQPIETLKDLIPEDPQIVCVGINPAPISVQVGHYYRGKLGSRFYSRLRQADLLPQGAVGWEDDAAHALGIGFTDVVKRPTSSASALMQEELRHGAAVLTHKLEAWGAPLVVFVFKGSAEAIIGSFQGNGFLPGVRVGLSEVFVMPGPYERRERVAEVLYALQGWAIGHDLRR